MWPGHPTPSKRLHWPILAIQGIYNQGAISMFPDKLHAAREKARRKSSAIRYMGSAFKAIVIAWKKVATSEFCFLFCGCGPFLSFILSRHHVRYQHIRIPQDNSPQCRFERQTRGRIPLPNRMISRFPTASKELSKQSLGWE